MGTSTVIPTLVLEAAPTEEPVTLEETKLYGHVTATKEDSVTQGLIRAAIEYSQQYTRRQFCTATWDAFYDVFPAEFALPLPPLSSGATPVTHIKYYDTGGIQRTLDPTVYDVDAKTEPARIRPAYGESWPSIRSIMNAVEVRFITGYGGADDVPEPIKQAIKFLVNWWFEERGPAIVGTAANELPMTYMALLTPYRMPRF